MLFTMSIISQDNRDKISSNVLRILFDEAPSPLSATAVASIEARDKQFILQVLHELERKHLVRNVTKDFSRKKYWVMTDQAYKKYRELLY